MRYRLLAALFAATLTACGASGGGGSDAAEPPATISDDPAVETTEAPEPAPEPVATTVVVTTTVDMAAEMREWAMEHAPSLDGVVGAIGDAADAGAAYDVRGLLRACGALLAEAEAFADHDSPPDAEMATELDAAMRHFRLGASACMSGVLESEPDLLDEATGHFETAAVHLQTASALLERYV